MAQMVAQAIGGRGARHLAKVERHFDHHAAVRRDHCGGEQRGMGKPGIDLHFGYVLVIQGQAVIAVGDVAIGLEPFDQCLAAARIARDRVAAVRPVRREQALADQRRQKRDEAGRIAAWIADQRGIRHLVPAGDFGKAEYPAIGSPVGRRSIDDPHFRVPGQHGGFAGGVVGQAENGEIGGMKGVTPGAGLLALLVVKQQQFKFAATFQPLDDLEPGGSGRAVDKHPGAHAGASS